jgi:hypothetical protein
VSYHYHAFGLNILSDVECPLLLPGKGQPDVTISYGAVPDNLFDVKGKSIYFQATTGKVLLKIPDIANYLIQNGDTIIIERHPDTDDDSVRMFLLGSVMGALLHSRGFLVLHANAIVVNGGAVLFMGESGVGKSTTAAAFNLKGYPIAADDICAIDINSEHPMLYSGFPQVKLWADACEKLEKDATNLRRIRPQLEKYVLPLGEQFCSEALPLKRLYILNTTNTKEFKLQEISSAEKFMALGHQTYRPAFMKAMGLQGNHLRQCARVAARIPLVRVTRPSGWYLLNELVELISQDLQNSEIAIPSGLVGSEIC